MLILETTTDILELVTSAAADVDVTASYVDISNAVPPVTQGTGTQLTAINTAATTTIVAAPGASKYRNVKALTIRNKHASLATDVTVVLDRSTVNYELHKVTLAAGSVLEFIEGIGFFTINPTTTLDTKLFVSADVTNSTTNFADITGLTVGIESGKKYNFDCCLIHQTSGTTVGAQFGVNGPAVTNLIAAGIHEITTSVTAATYGSSAAITALETPVVAETTGPGTTNMIAFISGGYEPSANGTFAMRLRAEVAGSVTVKRGSWCRIWQASN
jgi:hypothetical protein